MTEELLPLPFGESSRHEVTSLRRPLPKHRFYPSPREGQERTFTKEHATQAFTEVYGCEPTEEHVAQAVQNLFRTLDAAWWLDIIESGEAPSEETQEARKERQYKKIVGGLFLDTAEASGNEEAEDALLQEFKLIVAKWQAGEGISANAFSAALFERTAILDALGFDGIDDIFLKYFGAVTSRDVLRLGKIQKIPMGDRLLDTLKDMHPVWDHYLETRLSNNTFVLEVAGLVTVATLSYIRSQLWHPQNNGVAREGLPLTHNPILDFMILHIGDFLEAYVYSMGLRNTLGILFPRLDEKVLTGVSTGAALTFIGAYEMGAIEPKQPDFADVAFGGVIGAALYAIAKFASSRIMKGTYGLQDALKDHQQWLDSLDATQ